jgi:1-acyl-sn-glycerol-3-phosphate acyltransferase
MFAALRARRPGTSLPKIIFYEVCRSALAVAFAVLYRVRVHRADQVPASGAILLVANHQSYLDPPLIGFGIYHRQIDYLARMGLFRVPGLAWLIEALNATPIKEDSGDAGAIKEVLRRLGEGHAVLIFPEGSRSPDGQVHEFKRGTALLFRRADCPVIPVAIEGCYEAWPRNRRFPSVLGKRVAVRFGEPIAATSLKALGPDGALSLLREQIDAMRLELRAELRAASRGRYPPRGPADGPAPSTLGQAPPTIAPGAAP